jgi:hypothetical protein
LSTNQIEPNSGRSGQRLWVERDAADEHKPTRDRTFEAWGRSPDTTRSAAGLRRGYRGRFGMDRTPPLEQLGLAELTHENRNNRIRAI